MRIPIHILRPRLPHISSHVWALLIKALSFAGAVFIVFMLFSINSTSKRLAEEAKSTAEQNQSIARENGRHIDCIADLFARYTREQKPILKADLDKCQITEGQAAGLVGPALVSGAVDFSAPSQSVVQGQVNSSTNNSTNTTNTETQNNTNTPVTPPTVPEPTNQPVEVLGIPACVPVLGLCITH